MRPVRAGGGGGETQIQKRTEALFVPVRVQPQNVHSSSFAFFGFVSAIYFWRRLRTTASLCFCVSLLSRVITGALDFKLVANICCSIFTITYICHIKICSGRRRLTLICMHVIGTQIPTEAWKLIYHHLCKCLSAFGISVTVSRSTLYFSFVTTYF